MKITKTQAKKVAYEVMCKCEDKLPMGIGKSLLIRLWKHIYRYQNEYPIHTLETEIKVPGKKQYVDVMVEFDDKDVYVNYWVEDEGYIACKNPALLRQLLKD